MSLVEAFPELCAPPKKAEPVVEKIEEVVIKAEEPIAMGGKGRGKGKKKKV